MIEGKRVFTFNLLQKMRWMTGSSNDWGERFILLEKS